MTTPSVYACITTRDGAIRNDVMECFFNAVSRAQQAGVRVWAGRQQFNHGTAVCRNKAVADFLAHTDASHLLFVDDDVLVPIDSIHHIAESLAQPGVDIVCGAYPTYKFAGDTAYLYLTARPVGGDWLREWLPALVEIDAGGTGCMAIRREVFESVGFPWFRWPEKHDPATGTVQWVSDDVDFCASARHKGFRVWCDGRVQPGHLKVMDLKLLLNGALRWRDAPAPAEDGYGSHVGALRAIAKAMPVKVVVEYGSGKFSTPLFLDREAFPDLEYLYSVESNLDWLASTRERCGGDRRLQLWHWELGDMHHADPVADPDLVFIDCDTVEGNRHDFSARLRLIERYQTDLRAVVVVHDANFAAIRPAVLASTFKHKATYVPPFGPHTAILSNGVDVRTLFKREGKL